MIRNKVNSGQSKSGEFYIDSHVMMLKGLIFIFRDFANFTEKSEEVQNEMIQKMENQSDTIEQQKQIISNLNDLITKQSELIVNQTEILTKVKKILDLPLKNCNVKCAEQRSEINDTQSRPHEPAL